MRTDIIDGPFLLGKTPSMSTEDAEQWRKWRDVVDEEYKKELLREGDDEEQEEQDDDETATEDDVDFGEEIFDHFNEDKNSEEVQAELYNLKKFEYGEREAQNKDINAKLDEEKSFLRYADAKSLAKLPEVATVIETMKGNTSPLPEKISSVATSRFHSFHLATPSQQPIPPIAMPKRTSIIDNLTAQVSSEPVETGQASSEQVTIIKPKVSRFKQARLQQTASASPVDLTASMAMAPLDASTNIKPPKNVAFTISPEMSRQNIATFTSVDSLRSQQTPNAMIRSPADIYTQMLSFNATENHGEGWISAPTQHGNITTMNHDDGEDGQTAHTVVVAKEDILVLRPEPVKVRFADTNTIQNSKQAIMKGNATRGRATIVRHQGVAGSLQTSRDTIVMRRAVVERDTEEVDEEIEQEMLQKEVGISIS